MVKLRRNHNRTGSFGIRMLILVVGGTMALSWFIMRSGSIMPNLADPVEIGELIEREDPRWFLPSSTTGEVIHHDHYSLSYSEDHEQAEWVAYRLTRASLALPNVPRTDWFEEDPDVADGSAHYKDYSGSGYTRGHLVPAGDMAFNEAAMQSTFLMSNVSPQIRAFNNGIWKELEQQVRDWAYQYDSLIVVTGPVLRGADSPSIGRNQVTVPRAFYKIVLTIDDSGPITAGFIIPNALSTEKLENYMVTVDSIETVTGIDFFIDLLSDDLEDRLEGTVQIEPWTFNEGRFLNRINKWNKE